MIDLTEEKSLFESGYESIAALDEAGRGPLAGPVVAACVLITPDFKLRDKLEAVNDSKKLTEKKRTELYQIIANELPVGVGICDHLTIDRINILEATFLAMKKALEMLKQRPDIILVDGKFSVPDIPIKQKAIIDGDALIFSIAAASIVAKTVRDRIMLDYHLAYPDYAFDKHKGYGTKLHLEKLKAYGACPIHRRSFAPLKNHIT